MGGHSLLLLLLLSSILFSSGLQCRDSPQACTGDQVCRVAILQRVIYRSVCGPPLSDECQFSLVEGAPSPSSKTAILATECPCKTDRCEPEQFLPQVDKMAAKAKASVVTTVVHDRGNVSVLVYSILFGLSLSLVPLIIFFLVRLFFSKRKTDALESKVTSSLRQLQADMAGNSKNVHEVRKKMEDLKSSDGLHSGGSRDATVTGVLSGGTTAGGQKNETVEEQKKEEKKDEKKEEEPQVKSVTLGPH